jgi:uncharacterized membrane protein
VSESIREVVQWSHLATTLYMTGLIWFVQVVHYPLKAYVGAESFRDYQAQHLQRTGWVVMPPMLVEAMTAVWLVLEPPLGVTSSLPWIGLALLGVIWLSTGIFQIPAHRRLEERFDPEVVRTLVRTNWIRTVAWTARAGVVTALMMGWSAAP